MKNAVVFFCIIVLSTTWIHAQDTMSRTVNLKYYVNHPHWSDDTLRIDTAYRNWYLQIAANTHGEVAKKCHTKDSLKIYGIAAALYVEGMSFQDNSTEGLLDTTFDHMCEYFRIYLPNTIGGLDMLAQTEVCALDSIVGILRDIEDDDIPNHMAMRLYESYFDEGPISVIDTFYVGTTQYLDTQIITENENLLLSRRIFPVILSKVLGWVPDFPLEELDNLLLYDCRIGWYQRRGLAYIFPIYNPDEYHPTPDTTAIAESCELTRYVTVSPNPARTEVKVVSSFPIHQVEAYDASGRKMYVLEASGPQATLDVHSWPAGNYILKVNTPMGVFTKKLVIE